MVSKYFLTTSYLGILLLLASCQVIELHTNNLIARTFERFFEQQATDATLIVRQVTPSNSGGYVIIGEKQSKIIDDKVGFWIRTDEMGFVERSVELGVGNSTLDNFNARPLDIIPIEGGYATLQLSDFVAPDCLTFAMIDEDGRLVKTVCLSENSFGGRMAKTADGGFIIIERETLIKLDAEGEELWRKEGLGVVGIAVLILPKADNGFILTIGSFDTVGSLANYDENGNFLNLIGDYDFLNGKLEKFGLGQLSNGNLLFSGSSATFLGTSFTTDIYILEPSGNVLSTIEVRDLKLNSIKPTMDGGFIVAGSTTIELLGGNASVSADAIMIKISATGEEEWRNVYGGELVETGQDVIQLPDGGFVLAGTEETLSTQDNFPGEQAIYLVRTNRDGEF